MSTDFKRLSGNANEGIVLAVAGAGVAAGWATTSYVVGISASISTLGLSMLSVNLANIVCTRVEDAISRPERDRSLNQNHVSCEVG
jgi:hypothetical protein